MLYRLVSWNETTGIMESMQRSDKSPINVVGKLYKMENTVMMKQIVLPE